MIPKIIHYCWFGNKQKPESVLKCIQSWKRYCPDYEIIEWNEQNYNYKKNKYIYEAYNKKKWAFLTDFARLDILYEYGGIYLDTDVELVKSFDKLLDNHIFMGLEHINVEGKGKYWVNSGLGFGSEKNNWLLKSLIQLYQDREFVQKDGSLDLTPCPIITTDFLRQYGFIDDNCFQMIKTLKIYPTEYFAPKNYLTKELHITKNTYSIHHYDNSWGTRISLSSKLKKQIINIIFKARGLIKYE